MKVEPFHQNMVPETNTWPPPSHFPRLYAEHYFPISQPVFIPIQGFEENLRPGIAVPLRSIPPKEESAESNVPVRHNSSVKAANQAASAVLKPKQPRKKPSASKKPKGPVIPETKRERNNLDIDLNGAKFDLSTLPSPVCSCTGIAKVCYKWGAGGWQSSCCTISISEYPLPMSRTRPRSRMAGRKMSTGAYMKLLHRLADEGRDLSYHVDLKDHWARHGTNKFVTIK